VLGFDVDATAARLAGAGGAYEVVHESPGLEIGVYVLVAPEPDRQSPHAFDEVYVVLEGEGEIEVEDIPALWDAKMAELLGLDTRGNFKDGPMQDVHWPSGAFGYFPCYSLGAMYAAQWFAAMRRATPDLDARIAGGDFTPVFDWLRQHIWQAGSRWTTDELAARASGEPLNPAHFKAHLGARYVT